MCERSNRQVKETRKGEQWERMLMGIRNGVDGRGGIGRKRRIVGKKGKNR